MHGMNTQDMKLPDVKKARRTGFRIIHRIPTKVAYIVSRTNNAKLVHVTCIEPLTRRALTKNVKDFPRPIQKQLPRWLVAACTGHSLN